MYVSIDTASEEQLVERMTRVGGQRSDAEFVYRFWIENELWYALYEGGRVPEHLAWYAAGLRAAHP